MKNALKIIGGLIIGIAAGLIIGAGCVVMFTDTSLTEYIDKFKSTEMSILPAAIIVSILSFAASLVILITAHEAGHLVCGLASGYKFVSFRIFNYTFIKIDGRIRVKRYAIAGTGGQCLMTPPDLPPEKMPVMLYNAGGVLANILLLAAAVPFLLHAESPLVKEAIALFCLTDLFLILINGVPMKVGGIGNDAYNMLHLRHNLKAKRAMAVQLRSNALIQEGVRPRDMPAEWFVADHDIDYSDPIEAAMPMIRASRLIDEMKWDEAYEEFDKLYSRKDVIIQLYVYEIACELAFCAMVTGRTDRAQSLIDDKLRKYIDTYRKMQSTKQRLLFAEALCIESDADKASAIYEGVKSSRDMYLLRGEVDSDLAVMEQIRNAAIYPLA